jgi:hypothetical protein
LVSFLFGLSAFSQEITADKVPVPVRQTFNKQYPAAKMVKYEKENADYKVSFLQQGKQFIYTYNKAGYLLETDEEIATAAIPKAVTSTINKKFAGYTIMTVVKREAPDKGICYEMDLKKEGDGYTVRFSDQGEILQKIPRTVQFKVATKSTK